jgi:spoIIIJ-associated protein
MDDDQMLVEEPVAAANAAQEDEFDAVAKRFEEGALTDADLDLIADTAITYIRELLAFFGEDRVTVDEYEGDEGELILDISGGDLAVLIGRHGRTLDALQMVVSSFMSNRMHFHYPLMVDVEGYKTRRKEKLESLARSAAARVKRQHAAVKLSPMNAYERRIVHLTLLDDVDVTTHSEGEDPDRRVVITYVRN